MNKKPLCTNCKLLIIIVAISALSLIIVVSDFALKSLQDAAPVLRPVSEKSPDGTSRPTAIKIQSPKANEVVHTPLNVSGSALGSWFFEANFPITVIDANNIELGTGIATAQDDWMTEDFVPFTATIRFRTPSADTGFLVFFRDNPSGLPEHNQTARIPIRFHE